MSGGYLARGVIVRGVFVLEPYVALTVFSHSHYGYCKSFCRIDYIIPYV